MVSAGKTENSSTHPKEIINRMQEVVYFKLFHGVNNPLQGNRFIKK
jgi:hypothetical protein